MSRLVLLHVKHAVVAVLGLVLDLGLTNCGSLACCTFHGAKFAGVCAASMGLSHREVRLSSTVPSHTCCMSGTSK